MRSALKFIKWLVVVNVVAYAAGRVFKHFFPGQGDAGSARFDLVAAFEGREFASVAQALEGGSGVVVCGGIDLDLREANLCEEGSRLSFLTVFGGIRLIVPDTWKVVVVGSAFMGGTDVQVPAPNSLPDDAPSLAVDARTYLGGVQVIARG